jgi:hypothetical protein
VSYSKKVITAKPMPMTKKDTAENSEECFTAEGFPAKLLVPQAGR